MSACAAITCPVPVQGDELFNFGFESVSVLHLFGPFTFVVSRDVIWSNLLPQIAESFRRFGVLDTTTTLLAVKVIDSTNMLTASDPSIHLSKSVEGTRIEFNDANLKEAADMPRLIKIYKLTPGADMPGAGKRGKGARGGSNVVPEKQSNGTAEEVDQVKEMEAVIMGTMALKGS